jgi:pyruvate-formate lyase-activating enzyme/glutaredoxin
LIKEQETMTITIYSAKGCMRCKIVKNFLKDSRQTYQDYDALGEGRETFRAFYKNNRQKIYRGRDGVEFPIFCDDEVIRQGLPMVLAHLIAGMKLDGFFEHGMLHGQWVDGIHVSGGDPAHGEDLLAVLNILKKQAFKLQIDTNGVNAHLLELVLERGLADRVIMEVKGPLDLYDSLLQQPIDPTEIKKSIALVSQCDEYYFFSTISPMIREKGDLETISYITPEEIAEAAHLIKVATGDNKQPYRLRAFDPGAAEDPRLQECGALAMNKMFRYRTMARKHQFKTEILKD